LRSDDFGADGLLGCLFDSSTGGCQRSAQIGQTVSDFGEGLRDHAGHHFSKKPKDSRLAIMAMISSHEISLGNLQDMLFPSGSHE
jgi:hypothetical protein